MIFRDLKLTNLILLIILIAGHINAQNSNVSGFITDEKNGEALIGANVFIVETVSYTHLRAHET